MVKRISAAVLVAVLSVGAVAVGAGPAEARRDSGWGCGGAC